MFMYCLAIFLERIWLYDFLESGAAKQEQGAVSQERRGLTAFILSRLVYLNHHSRVAGSLECFKNDICNVFNQSCPKVV